LEINLCNQVIKKKLKAYKLEMKIFSDGIIIYLENSKEQAKKFLQTREFHKILRHKINKLKNLL
jgi:hypothetical protein